MGKCALLSCAKMAQNAVKFGAFPPVKACKMKER